MYWYYIVFWPIIYLGYSYLYSNYNKVVIFNLISALHSIGCFYFALMTYHEPVDYNYQRMSLFSCSYFIWDSYKLILTNTDLIYLYHHIVSIHVLEKIFLLDEYRSFYIMLIIIGELSNFPNYLVYHLLKTSKENFNKIKYWKHVQLIWFIFFRIFIYGFVALKVYLILNDKFTILNLYAMYLLGVLWGFKQFKGVYQNYYCKIKNP